jgi:O-antigen ligase
LKNKTFSSFKNYLIQRATHPVESVVLFLPIVAFFLPLDQFLFFGTICCLVIVLNLRKFSKAVLFRKNYLFFIFSVYMLVLALLNKNVMGLIAVGFLLLILIYMTSLRTFITKGIFETLMFIIGVGSLFSLYYCTVDFYTTTTYKLYEFFMVYIHIPYTYVTQIAEGIRSASTFIDPNYYGHISAFIALISLYYILSSLRSLLHKQWLYVFKLVFYSVILCVNIYALYLTQSRSAFIGLLIAGALMILVFDARVFIGLSIPLVLFITFKYDVFISIFPRLGTATIDFNYRLTLYKAAFSEILKHPFIGRGFYTYPLVYENYTTGYQLHTHNIFIELWLDSGLLGLSLITASYLTYIKRPFKVWVNKRREYMPLVCGVLALEVVNGLTDAVLIFPQSFVLLSLILLSLEIREETH